MSAATARASRWVTVSAIVLVIGISLLAFLLSFAVLRDLATRSGVPEEIAWAWPLIVDGSIVTAMLVIFEARGQGRRATAWPWVTLTGFAVVSIVGNGVHTAAVHDPSQGITTWLAVCVGAVPPVGLLLSSEMLVRLLSRGHEAAADTLATEESVTADAVTTRATEPAPEDEVSAAEGDAPGQSHTRPQEPLSAPYVSSVPHEHMEAETPSPEPVLGLVRGSAQRDSESVGDDMALAADDSRPEVGDTMTALDTEPRDERDTERVPAEPADQVAWILSRAREGRDITKHTLARLFDDAGQSVSLRTIQRRLAEARATDPEAFQVRAL